ncbi:hypothetical protein BJV82DRAFT_598173, partial [Fennellomyces sp. T-0311]
MECSSNKRNPVDDYFAAFDAVLTSEDDSDEVPDTAARLPQRKRTQHSQATTIETPLPSDDEDVPLVKNRRVTKRCKAPRTRAKSVRLRSNLPPKENVDARRTQKGKQKEQRRKRHRKQQHRTT